MVCRQPTARWEMTCQCNSLLDVLHCQFSNTPLNGFLRTEANLYPRCDGVFVWRWAIELLDTSGQSQTCCFFPPCRKVIIATGAESNVRVQTLFEETANISSFYHKMYKTTTKRCKKRWHKTTRMRLESDAKRLQTDFKTTSKRCEKIFLKWTDNEVPTLQWPGARFFIICELPQYLFFFLIHFISGIIIIASVNF